MTSEVVVLTAKLLVAAIFLANAFGIIDQRRAVHELQSAGVPARMAPIGILMGRVTQVVGCGLLFWPQTEALGAVVLAGFLIPATLVAHPFWKSPREERSPQLANFLKNVCMTGGLLVFASRGLHG